MPKHNIYEDLIKGPEDIAGMLGYCNYKIKKIEFIKHYQSTEGRFPTEEEFAVFHTTNSLENSIETYRSGGRAILDNLVQNLVLEKLKEIEKDVNDSFMMKKLEEIKKIATEKNTLAWWIKNMFSNLGANILVIGFVGLIILGYNGLSKLNKTTENVMQIKNNEEAKQDNQDEKPK